MVQVADQAKCPPGTWVIIGYLLPNGETELVIGVGALILGSPLRNDHAVGERVVGTTPPNQPVVRNDPNNQGKEDEKPKETDEQRQQRERTNRGGKDDVYMEGNVVGVRCDLGAPVPSVSGGSTAKPDAVPYALIANRDGVQQVLLIREAVTTCGSIRVGDYLEADGEKVHEQLFEADSVTIKRGGSRVH